VGNISRAGTEQELKEAFEAFSAVESAAIIMDRFSGGSRGFVEVAKKEEADKAISALSGKDMKGRNLTVNEARPPTGGGGGLLEVEDAKKRLATLTKQGRRSFRARPCVQF
jgi:RNA recognition motif-containing protein